MKQILVIGLLFFSTTGLCQAGFAGQFKPHIDTGKYIFPQKLNLNCDGIFLWQTGPSILFGKWSVNKGSQLILKTDSAFFESRKTIWTKTIKLTITEGKLYLKGTTKREYRKSNRALEKSTGEVPMTESYSDLRKRESDNYFERVAKYHCDQPSGN